MSGGNGRQSSSEVAHEAEGTRAHLASTLEQLRTNLQPGNVVEEVVSNARIGAAAVADNLADIAKQHPLPATLIAAGSALILRVFSRRGGAEASRRPPALRGPGRFRPAPGREGSIESSGPSGDRTGLVDDLSVEGAALQRRAGDLHESTSSQAGAAMRNVTRYLPSGRGEVRSKLSNLLEEQPLILGAIGLAVGAAIGAALPITDAEDHLMGTTSHRFRDSASGAARHEIDEMRSAAGEAIDNVRHSAQDNIRTVVGKAGDSLGTGSRDA